MDLREFTSGTPATKPWLNIVAHDVKTSTLEADTAEITDLVIDDLEAKVLTLIDVASVPNPSIGKVTFFSTGNELKSTNPAGDTVRFVVSPAGDPLDMNGNSVVGLAGLEPFADGKDDIGTSSLQFQDLYLSNEIRGIAAIRPAASNIIIGATAAVTAHNGHVIIGDSATTTGAGGFSNVVIGDTATASGTAAIAIGNGASEGGSDGNLVIGHGATCTGGGSSVVIGESSTASSGTSIAIGNTAATHGFNTIALGTLCSNSDDSTFLFGDPAVANIRPNNDATCDLGSGAARFHDLYLSNSIQGSPTITSPTLVTPTLGAATATSVTFSPTTGGIVGTTTNDNAAAGKVGEYISNSAGPIATTSNTSLDVTSISLTAGDWDVEGTVLFTPAASTVPTRIRAGINTTSATIPSQPGTGSVLTLNLAFTTGSQQCAPLGGSRLSLSATTTVYLVANTVFTVSTMDTYGFIGARRVR